MADEMISLDKVKFAPGAEQARQDVMVGVSVAMTVIGMTCVALRVYTRGHIVRNMGPEDWTMIAAAVLTLTLTFELIVAAKNFMMGFSNLSIPPGLVEKNIQMILAIAITYKLVVTLIKISILMIYLRLAVERLFGRLCKGTIYLLMTWQFIVFIVVPSQCTPLRKLWDLTGQVQGTCININAFYYATSAFHIIIDIWILILPIKLVLGLPRPPREKFALYFVFGLGLFTTIASIVRFHYLIRFTLSNDLVYDSHPMNIWSVIEVNVGILCASLPTLKPLVSKTQRNRTREVLNQQVASTQSTKTFGLKKGLRVVHAKEMSVSSPLSLKSDSWPSSSSSFKRGTASTFASSLRSAKSSIYALSIKRGKTPAFDEEFELAVPDVPDVPPPVPPKDEPVGSRSPTQSPKKTEAPRTVSPKLPAGASVESQSELSVAYRNLEDTLRLPATVYTPPR